MVLLVFLLLLIDGFVIVLDVYFQAENEKLVSKLQEKQSLLNEVCVTELLFNACSEAVR